VNTGAPDWLLGAQSDRAEVTLFAPEAEGGLPVQTGRSLLASDGAHLILTASPEPIEPGALVPITLTFADAGDVQIKMRMSDGPTDPHAGHNMHYLVGADEPAPSIDVTPVKVGDGWRIDIETRNFEFSEEQQGQDHNPGFGHGHVYVGGMKVGRVYGSGYAIGALPPGEHLLRITLNTNNHRQYAVDGTPVEATAVIMVD
jgi:3',5'-cyclic AMP phosphodiesterase CpdA